MPNATSRRRRLASVAGCLIMLGAAAGVLPGAEAAADARPAAGAVAGPNGIAPVASCASLAGLDVARVETSIASAAEVTRVGHAYCSVTGYISPQTRFEVLLPTATWTGDYLQQGCGGFCGHVDLSLTDPSRTSGYQAPFAPLSNGELVVAADDQGHEAPNNTDTLWARNDPALRVVFGYSSEHSMARTSRALIRAYYGRDAAHRYFDGVSDGGHEALALAQRYPDDFDGIIAGAPANNWAALAGLFEPWLARVNLNRNDRQILTAEKLPALHTAVMRACADASGVITDPRACTFRPESLRCQPGADTVSCLTPAQVAVVRAFYRGPTDSRGRNLFDGGMPYGSELAWQVWAVQPAADTAAPLDTVAAALGLNYLRNAAFWHNPPVTLGLRDVRFTAAEHRRLQEVGDIYDATNPDLRRFAARGGKLIMWQGWADTGSTPFGTLTYYDAVVRYLGQRATDRFLKLYMIPGVYHCGGGPTPATADYLTPLMTWQEQGLAPNRIVTSFAASPTDPTITRTRPAFPYPSIAKYTGSGNPNDQANWVQAPPEHHYAAHYPWLGDSHYSPRFPLWCRQEGLTMMCRRRAEHG